MLFSSAIFLFTFLPITIIVYYLLRGTWRNVFLLFASLIFFAWGGVGYSMLLIISIFLNYAFGFLINNAKQEKKTKLYLTLGITANLLMLAIFKYTGFLVENFNDFITLIDLPPFPVPKIILPIGISFYTFQALSYLIDLYRKETAVQKNILRLGLYISLFPQLIAGPIVRYHDIAHQLQKRTFSFEKFSYGVKRFLTGLAKKVLIANSFALIADHYFGLNPMELSVTMAWMGIIAYTFQIYFDFSGYSDMAIGLAAIFGFRIPENFNFPYAATSIRDFWRKWHISLSTWFRDYLYIPLGGSRGSIKRTYLNLFIVFFLTGLWHGSSWSFIIWGLIHGLFMVIERIGFDRILKQTWKPMQYLYSILIVMMAWVFFRADDFQHAFSYFGALAGNGKPLSDIYEVHQYLNLEMLIITIIALLASVNAFKIPMIWIKEKINHLPNSFKIAAESLNVLVINTYFLAILIISAFYLLAESYNPFIYFRF